MNQRDLRIIRSAPELLAALEDMVNLVDDCFEGGAELDADDADIDLRIKKSVALINKARGDE